MLLQKNFEQQVLAYVGLGRVRRVYRHYVMLMAFASAILIVLGISVQAGDLDRLFKIAATVTALITFLLTYAQWRAARHEISLDKYYDRLHLANERFNAHRLEELKNDEAGKISHLQTMFIFYQLDLLEYMLETLKLGYVHPVLAERTIRAFTAWCENEGTRASLTRWVGEQDQEGDAKGYEMHTREAARFIVRSFGPRHGGKVGNDHRPLPAG
jgi:hypothetical protein